MDLSKINNWLVEKCDERPARMDGTCFYCHEPIGGTHKESCVIPSKLVRLKLEITFDNVEPIKSDAERLRFRYNEGSWCKSNMISRLQELSDELGCLCKSDMRITVVEDNEQ